MVGQRPRGPTPTLPSSTSLQEHQGPALANRGSPTDSPAHEVPSSQGSYTRFDMPQLRVKRSWPSLRGGHVGAGWATSLPWAGADPYPLPTALLLRRYAVARVIWTHMLSIAVTYFITLCLFPGLESEIRHCILGEWLPILLMAVFNLSDFVGKVGPHLSPPLLEERTPQAGAVSCRRVDPELRCGSRSGRSKPGDGTAPVHASGREALLTPQELLAVSPGPAVCPGRRWE